MALSYCLAVAPAPWTEHGSPSRSCSSQPAWLSDGDELGLPQSSVTGLSELFTGLFVRPFCQTAFCPGWLKRGLVPGLLWVTPKGSGFLQLPSAGGFGAISAGNRSWVCLKLSQALLQVALLPTLTWVAPEIG